MKIPAVYILANKPHGTLYIGVTSDLVKRIWQHKESVESGFSNKYKVHSLVWYEIHDNMYMAISREKAMKKWRRAWKVKLIEKKNPLWLDLYSQIL